MKFKRKFQFHNRFALAPNAEGGGEGGGVPPTTPPAPAGEDVSGLKSALAKERQLKTQFESQFKALQASFEGIDPVAAKQALDNYQKLTAQQEEWNQKETTLKTTLTEDFNRRFQAESSKVKEWETKHNDLLSRTLAQQAFEAAGGRAGGSEDGVTFFDSLYNNYRNSFRLNEKGQMEVVDSTGARLYSAKNTSEPMSPAEFFAGKVDHPVFSYCFAATQDSKGGGMRPGAGKTPANGMVRVIARNDVNALSEPGVIEALAAGDPSIVVR
jgi:hypothetical protein